MAMSQDEMEAREGAANLLDALRERGFKFGVKLKPCADGGHYEPHISPAANLEPNDRAAIARHRRELIFLLLPPLDQEPREY